MVFGDWSRKAFLLTATAIGLCVGIADACAQSANIPPPPVREPVDENGVDVSRGLYPLSTIDLSIGGEKQRGLRSALKTHWQAGGHPVPARSIAMGRL